MNRKDIELYVDIKIKLEEFCISVLQRLFEGPNHVGPTEFNKVTTIDVTGENVRCVYPQSNSEHELVIPIEYVLRGDVDGFCRYYYESIKKNGKRLNETEFVELAAIKQWGLFCKIFEVCFPPNIHEHDELTRAKAELYNRIKSSMLLFRLYKGDSNGYCIEVFTEKDIDLLYSIFVDFVNWANLNEYWSQRRNDIKFADLKKELVIKQQDIIEKIKSKENHTERELNYAVNTLNVIKKMN